MPGGSIVPATSATSRVELGRQLGLQVTLEAVRYPRPGEVVYRGIVLRQEEPRGKGLTEIARAELVRLRSEASAELTLHAENLKLSGESPKQAMAQVEALIRRSGALALRAAPSGRTDLRCRPRSGGTSLLASGSGRRVPCRPLEPDSPGGLSACRPWAGTRCELTLNRDRTTEPARTISRAQRRSRDLLCQPGCSTSSSTVPTGWARRRRLMERSACGQIGAADWEADFQGNLIDVDLSTLVGRRFPRHHLSGNARVALQSARWGDRPGQGTGWREARGELIASRARSESTS